MDLERYPLRRGPRTCMPCRLYTLILLAFLLSLSGCGGGGSSADSGAGANPGQLTNGGSSPTKNGSGAHVSSLNTFILPFDTADGSVVLRSTLTTPASVTDAGGMEESTSSNTYDPVLGMKPDAPASGVPGVRFSTSSIAALSNLPSGQLSIEVEREWLATTNSEIRSYGYNHADTEHLLSYGNGLISDAGRIHVQPTQELLWSFLDSEGSKSFNLVNTSISDRFARITLSWTPTRSTLYIDGLQIASLPRTDPSPGRFSTIFIGNYNGTTQQPFSAPFYVRNLLVSSKPVEITPHPMLAHIMHIGDSFAAGQPFSNTSPIHDGSIVNTVIKELISRGAGFTDYSVFSNGGGQLQDNGGDPLELDAGKSLDRAGALAQNPSLVVLITGGNDTAIYQETQFTPDLHDHIEAYLGVNGHPATTTQHVIVTTTTSNLNATHPSILGMVQIMRDLPAWWDSTYPDRAGAVSVIDTWTLFGGPTADSTLFKVSDLIHPSAKGNLVYGRAIADEIIRLVDTP